MSLHVCSHYQWKQKHNQAAVESMIEYRLWNKSSSLQMHGLNHLSVSIQMARSFSGAYENNVVPAILVGLLIVCHPPVAICQGPLVPEPCAEALPCACTSLTPSCHLTRLTLSPSYSSLPTSGRECPCFAGTSEPLMSRLFLGGAILLQNFSEINLQWTQAETNHCC